MNQKVKVTLQLKMVLSVKKSYVQLSTSPLQLSHSGIAKFISSHLFARISILWQFVKFIFCIVKNFVSQKDNFQTDLQIEVLKRKPLCIAETDLSVLKLFPANSYYQRNVGFSSAPQQNPAKFDLRSPINRLRFYLQKTHLPLWGLFPHSMSHLYARISVVWQFISCMVENLSFCRQRTIQKYISDWPKNICPF